MLQILSMIAVGWLFAVGLGISGMTDPAIVIGFLNLRGSWDPSLVGVMVGAIGVYSLSFPLIRRFRAEPVHDDCFQIPTKREIDLRLLVGSALFGAGWGLAGVCPGPGLTCAVSGAQGSLGFLAAMVVGMFVYQRTLAPPPCPCIEETATVAA